MTRARARSCALLCGCCLLGMSQAGFALEVRGARSCAGWQQFRLEEQADNPLSAQIYQTWLVGYLSGLNAASGVNFLLGVPNDSIFRMVDGYCFNNGQTNLAAAGTFVARSLLQQKGIPNPDNWP